MNDEMRDVDALRQRLLALSRRYQDADLRKLGDSLVELDDAAFQDLELSRSGPSYDESSSASSRIPRWARTPAAGFAAFVVVLLIGVVPLLLAPSSMSSEDQVLLGPSGSSESGQPGTGDHADGSPTTSPDGPPTTRADGSPTTSEESISPVTFVPEPPMGTNPIPMIAEHLGDIIAVEVTFTDGRRVVLEYPASWELERRVWRPNTGLVLELETPRSDGLGYLFAQAVYSYSERDGWKRSTFFNPNWTTEEEKLVDELLQETVQPNGFVVIGTSGNLKHFTTAPDEGPTIPDLQRSAWIDVGDLVTLVSGCHPNEGVSEATYVAWCDPAVGVLISVTAPPEFHDQIREQLRVRPAS